MSAIFGFRTMFLNMEGFEKVVALLLYLTAFLVSPALAQDGAPQRRSLMRLGSTSNSSLVNSSLCTTRNLTTNNETSTSLYCPFVADSEQLIVDLNTRVALHGIQFLICLCDSAMTVKYTLTNDTDIMRQCNQCPVEIPIGRLQLFNNFSIFNVNGGVTQIGVLVELSLITSSSRVAVFNNNVTLNQQIMACPTPISPPKSCDVPTVPPSGEDRTLVIVVAVCIPVVVILLIIAAVFITVGICLRRRSQNLSEKQKLKPT